MCGIAGICTDNNDLRANLVVKDMLTAIRHRGPDDEGYLAVDVEARTETPLIGIDSVIRGKRIEDCLIGEGINLILGHRRLSIIDLSELGHQPMSNNDKTIWIVYNGEIYNYIELKKELVKHGYHFKSRTDTEVVIAAYEMWGVECVNKFNGMWSFVIYDKKNGMLFGSRDRFGVKPMYYAIGCGFFTFASEIKSLITVSVVKREVNQAAIFDYLVLGWEDREEETAFKEIYELMPAHSFTYNIRNGQFKKWQYYELNLFDKWEDFNERCAQDHAEQVKWHFTNAVKFRLRSDVYVGSCLSGGLDSSSIVCTVNNCYKSGDYPQLGQKQSVFTACYDDSSIDERKWARCVVDHTGASWNTVFPNPKDFLADIERLIYCQDLPFGSSSIYAQYRVMNLAKEQGVNVLLDGQGGDELFGGYESSTRAFYAEMLKGCNVGAMINECKNKTKSNLSKKEIFKPVLRTYINNILPNEVRRRFYRYSRVENKYINPDFWNKLHCRTDQVGGHPNFSLNRQLYDLMTKSNLKTLLRYEDRNSMCFSIESRTPFADDIELIEYVFRLPSVYKIRSGINKYILKRAMVDTLPEEILNRSTKIGFETPERAWLQDGEERLKNYFNDSVADVMDVHGILRDWRALMNVRSCSSRVDLWRFINYAIWHKVYFQ